MLVPMKKAYIACLREDREALIDALFSVGEVMLIDQEGKALSDTESAAKLKNAEALLKAIRPYAPKKGMFSPRPEVDEERFNSVSAEALETQEQLLRLIAERDELASRAENAKKAAAELELWRPLDADAQDIGASEYVVSRVGSTPSSKAAKLIAAAEGVVEIELLGERGGRSAMLAVCAKEDARRADALLREYEFEEARLPFSEGRAEDEYNRQLSVQAEAEAAKAEKEKELAELSQRAEEITLLADQLRADRDKDEAPLVLTGDAVYIEGWVRSDRTEKVTAALKKAVGDGRFAVEYADPAEGEKPPTAAKNSRFVTPFESITNMFSAPDPNEIDPNPVMAPWYWIIFGMMMADVGYGLLMLIGAWLFRKFMKPRGEMAKLVSVIGFSGIPTIIFGVVFGSYFGAEWFPPLIGFSLLDGILPVLLIACGVGMLHIFTGMVIKAVAAFRAGDWQTAVFDNFAWMALISGLIVMALNVKVGAIIAGAAALVVLFTAGRNKPNVIGKLTGGFGSLYGITGYLSDILSYSRILALCISTAVIGYVMNILAGLVMGIPVAGYVFAGLVYIVGHLFNLAMGLLSAYVHDSRLQYIEFFTRFYEGGGTVFKPFRLETKNVDVVRAGGKDKSE
ncbi:MAG: V-type ATP synthase subunit I [Clostridia bacterium]|nr:V-type ATP synthase subunit I [Clostridia bacterium]